MGATQRGQASRSPPYASYDRRVRNRLASTQNGGQRLAHRTAGSALHLARRPRSDRTEIGTDRGGRRGGRLREHVGDGPLLPDRGVGEAEEPMLEGYSALTTTWRASPNG